MKGLKYLYRPVLALTAAMLVALGASVEATQASLSEKLIRLHVIGASDSAYDQSVKLRVRDAILELTGTVLENCDSLSQAEDALRWALDDIESTARRISGGSARATLSVEEYPVREYDTFTLPAGEYRSLRVILDSGEGRNWWCVVFPPLCDEAGAVEDVEEAFADLGEDDTAVITGDGVIIRFKLVEWARRLLRLFSR